MLVYKKRCQTAGVPRTFSRSAEVGTRIGTGQENRGSRWGVPLAVVLLARASCHSLGLSLGLSSPLSQPNKHFSFLMAHKSTRKLSPKCIPFPWCNLIRYGCHFSSKMGTNIISRMWRNSGGDETFSQELYCITDLIHYSHVLTHQFVQLSFEILSGLISWSRLLNSTAAHLHL